MTDDSDRKYVIFLDSLGTDDIAKMPWTEAHLTFGEMDARPVYVTPFVLGSVYTGKPPGENGLPSVSRHDGQARGRPDGLTIPEMAAATDQYETVVQMGWPFIVPPEVDAEGEYYHHSAAMGQVATGPAGVENQIATPSPPGDLDKTDENFELAFDARVDHCQEAFARMRNFSLEADADVVFFGYRVLDSYTHYQRTEDYRDLLLEEVDRQLKYTDNLGDVFVWGDHGSMEMDELFRINRWLIEKGYLSVDIDLEWRERGYEYGAFEREEGEPGDTLHADSPGVTVHEGDSVAIGSDPFSTGITLLEGATDGEATEMLMDLLEEDAFVDVHNSADTWPGKHVEEFPDFYAERRPGVFVSGNLHPEPGGAEVTRDGVHHPFGAFGTRADTLPNTDPVGLFSVIAEGFLDLDVAAARGLENQRTLDREIDHDPRDHLEDMGYL